MRGSTISVSAENKWRLMLSHNGTSAPLFPRLREEERMLRAGGRQEPETPFSEPGMAIAPVNSQLCSQDPHNLGPGNAPSWMREGLVKSSPFPGAGYWRFMVATGRGVTFFSDVVTVNFPMFHSITLKSSSCKQTLN